MTTTSDLARRIVLAAQRERGTTIDEVVEATGALHQTVSAMVSRMAARGLLAPTSLTRPTRTGRPGTVYVMSAEARFKVDAMVEDMRRLLRGEVARWTAEECDVALLAVARHRRGEV